MRLYRSKNRIDWGMIAFYQIIRDKKSIKSLEVVAIDEKNFGIESWRQEMLETILNQYI
jgi:xylose isomerase